MSIAEQAAAASKAAFNSELRVLLEQVERVRVSKSSSANKLESWLNKPVGWKPPSLAALDGDDEDGGGGGDNGGGGGGGGASAVSRRDASRVSTVPVEAKQAQLLAYCYQVISQLSAELGETMLHNSEREEIGKLNLSEEFATQEKFEARRQAERSGMAAEDPRVKAQRARAAAAKAGGASRGGGGGGGAGGGRGKLGFHSQFDEEEDEEVEGEGEGTGAGAGQGSHLAPLSHLDAMRRVEAQYRSNNEPVASGFEASGPGLGTPARRAVDLDRAVVRHTAVLVDAPPSLFACRSVEELASALTSMHSGIRENLSSLKTILARKDAHFKNIKDALTTQLVEKRQREEGS
jgi:hypothetical protein